MTLPFATKSKTSLLIPLKLYFVTSFGIELEVKKVNVSNREILPLEEKLEKIKKKVGEQLYEELLKANEIDLKLYDLIRDRYHAKS